MPTAMLPILYGILRPPMDHPTRLHALDNLRAIMMWLGIVVHVAAGHTVATRQSLWSDPQTSPVADLLDTSIHAFRIPVFFIIAGFFVALLVERRGPGGMLAHRARRVGLPFMVFWPIVFTATVALETMYVRPPAGANSRSLSDEIAIWLYAGGPFETLHLWFLLILLGLAAAAAVLCWLLQRVPRQARDNAARWLCTLAANPGVFLVLALPLALLGRNYWLGILTPSGWFLPPLAEWLHHGLFFFFGLLLYRWRDRLLPLYERRVWPNALAGAVALLIAVAIALVSERAPNALAHPNLWIGLAYNACTWLWSLALIGGFVRYLPGRNRLLKYLAESSYWVYLVHLPCVVAVALVLRDLSMAAELKMLLNIAATSLVGLASYQALVRYTPIGTFLNGPRTGDR